MKLLRICSSNGKKYIIADSVIIADRFLLRLKGLLGRKEIVEGEGIILYPCSSIHCYGMKFSIDAFFLDKNRRIIYIYENMKPNTYKAIKGSKYVVELKAGIALQYGIKVGDAFFLQC